MVKNGPTVPTSVGGSADAPPPSARAAASRGSSRSQRIGPDYVANYTPVCGAGARTPSRIRAAAQAAAAADRLDRPGRGRGARGRAREALDQEGRQGLGARAG